MHVQSFPCRVFTLPPPQLWPSSSAWHLAHAQENENSELFRTFFCSFWWATVPEEILESKGHGQGSWLLSVLRCRCPRENTMNMFRLGSSRLHQGLGLSSGLGRFCCGCKTNPSLEPSPAPDGGITGELSRFTLLLQIWTCLKLHLQAPLKLRVNI